MATVHTEVIEGTEYTIEVDDRGITVESIGDPRFGITEEQLRQIQDGTLKLIDLVVEELYEISDYLGIGALKA